MGDSVHLPEDPSLHLLLSGPRQWLPWKSSGLVPAAAVTGHHQVGALKQYVFSILHFRRPQVQSGSH